MTDVVLSNLFSARLHITALPSPSLSLGALRLLFAALAIKHALHRTHTHTHTHININLTDCRRRGRQRLEE